MNGDQFGEVNPNHFLPHNQHEADKNLLVKFFLKPRQDKEASQKEGRPIFREVEYIDIKIPGKRDSGACRPATEDDKRRFPNHYRAFKDRTDQSETEGTPLSEWPLISRSMAEELSFFHVKTVEQLATMSDTQASKFMGLAGIRQKAKVWLEQAKTEKPLFDMDQKIKAQEAEIASLKEALNNVLKRVDGVQDDEEDDGKTEAQKKRARSRAIDDAKDKVA